MTTASEQIAAYPPDPDRVLAFQLYAAYGDAAGWKNFQGAPMPEWDALPERIRTFWTASAKRARAEINTDRIMRAQARLAERVAGNVEESDRKPPVDAGAAAEVAALVPGGEVKLEPLAIEMKGVHIHAELGEQPMSYARRLKIETAAAAAHMANRAYCIALGDESQVPWPEADDAQKKSARQGVERVLAGDSPEQLHESWMAARLADGWVWGQYKDPKIKTHPCLVPYAELPAAQRMKDALFQSTVRAVLAVWPLSTEGQS